MLRQIRYLVLTVLGLMLFSVIAHAGATHDPTFDVSLELMLWQPAVMVDADIASDDIDKTDYTYALEWNAAAAAELERSSAFSRSSKPVALPAYVAIESFRLNLKVPWQYLQA